jgi:hypothetical protein
MTQVAQVGGPVTRGASWFVPSATGSWGSFVDMSAQKIRWTCPSFGHRRRRLLGVVYPRTFYTDVNGLLCKTTEGANLQS